MPTADSIDMLRGARWGVCSVRDRAVPAYNSASEAGVARVCGFATRRTSHTFPVWRFLGTWAHASATRFTKVRARRAAAAPAPRIHRQRASFDANLAGLRGHFRVMTGGNSAATAIPMRRMTPPSTRPRPPVARLLGLIDELGYERVLLCGHSLGGARAAGRRSMRPARISGLDR